VTLPDKRMWLTGASPPRTVALGRISGGRLPPRQTNLVAGILLIALSRPMTAQEVVIQPDSARSQIRAVLRAFYRHWENQNWDALSPYVLSPKLLERRGSPGDVKTVTRDRKRSRGSSHAASAPRTCLTRPSALIDEAEIRLDGDWAEISVPRCSRASAGVDELRMLYFEQRWRFIYTDLFDGSPGGGE
jgi:hypothetical protein